MKNHWLDLSLGEICTTQYGLSVAASENGTTPILGMRNLQEGRVVVEELSRVNLETNDIDRCCLEVGDVLFNRTNSADLVGKTAIVETPFNEKTVFASYLLRLQVDETQALPAYVNHFLNSPQSEKRLKCMATPGVSQFNINATSLRNHFRIQLPSLAEQRELTRVFDAWDLTIRQLTDLIMIKKRFKVGLLHQLLIAKRRFLEFELRPLASLRLGEFLTFTPRPIPRPCSAYTALGLRSHGKGTFVRQVDDPSTVQMDTLFQVCNNDLIVNITFAWEGAIAIASLDDEYSFVSHRFPTFTINGSVALPEYLRHVIVAPWFVFKLGLVSPGGAGRNRVMNKRDFLKIAVPLPEIDEQNRIASLLNGLNEELSLLNRQLELLKLQKKGLMQKLLTGQVRVKLPKGAK